MELWESISLYLFIAGIFMVVAIIYAPKETELWGKELEEKRMKKDFKRHN